MVYIHNWAVEAWSNFIRHIAAIRKGKEANSQQYKMLAKMDGNNLIIQLMCMDAASGFYGLLQ